MTISLSVLTSKIVWATAGFLFFFNAVPGAIRFYYEYIDQTNYVSFKGVVKTEKTLYEPCEKVFLAFERKSQGNFKVDSDKALVSLNTDNGDITKRFFPTVAGVISEGEATVKVPVDLPCGIEAGLYYWEGAFHYTYRDVKKITYWKSSQFNVK